MNIKTEMKNVNAISDEFVTIRDSFMSAFNGLKKKYGVSPTLMLKEGIGVCYEFDYDQMLESVSSKGVLEVVDIESTNMPDADNAVRDIVVHTTSGGHVISTPREIYEGNIKRFEEQGKTDTPYFRFNFPEYFQGKTVH